MTTEAETIPVEAAKSAPTRTTLTAKPPLVERKSALMETKSFSAICDFSKISPIAINKGTAMRVVLDMMP